MSIVLTRQVQHDEALMRLSNALMPFAFQISLGATLLRNLIQLLRFFFFHPRRDKCACACSTVYASQARINSQKKKKGGFSTSSRSSVTDKTTCWQRQKACISKKKKKERENAFVYGNRVVCHNSHFLQFDIQILVSTRESKKEKTDTHTHTQNVSERHGTKKEVHS